TADLELIHRLAGLYGRSMFWSSRMKWRPQFMMSFPVPLTLAPRLRGWRRSSSGRGRDPGPEKQAAAFSMGCVAVWLSTCPELNRFDGISFLLQRHNRCCNATIRLPYPPLCPITRAVENVSYSARKSADARAQAAKPAAAAAPARASEQAADEADQSRPAGRRGARCFHLGRAGPAARRWAPRERGHFRRFGRRGERDHAGRWAHPRRGRGGTTAAR